MDLFEPTLFSYLSLLILLVALPFWFIRIIKITLFYLYLWQLKEYHIGRFLDHFRTAKGKQLLVNKILFGEILLLLFPISFLFFILYGLDALKTGIDVVQGRIKTPVFTKKVIPLIGLNITFAVMFLIVFVQEYSFFKANTVKFLLLYSVLTPIITSATVLIFQPLAVLGRNQIIQKAKRKRAKLKNLKVIGITGSYGKTTTKEILAHILSQKFNVIKTPEHKNSEIGISQVVLNSLTNVHDIFVCEMGAYNKGGIKLLADIVRPDIGIVTGVNEQHLATFGSMENLLSAEGGRELVDSLPKDGVVILNGNNKYCRDLYEKTEKPKKVLCYAFSTAVENASSSNKSDMTAEDLKVGREYIEFRIISKDGEKADFKVNVMGGHNVENILLAVAGAKELGMSLQEIAKACESITEEMGAMKLRKGVNGLNIIDSTYSANPDGVIAALEYLKVWKGRKVIVMPCLIELGKASKEVHRRIGEKIGEVCDLAIITTKDCFKELKQGAMSKAMEEGQVLFQENPQKIFDMIKNINHEEDVILLESRVPSRLIELVND